MEKNDSYRNSNRSCLLNPDDYLPCKCWDDNFILCYAIPLNVVRKIFKEPAKLEVIQIIVPLTEDIIPPNLFGDNHAKKIILQCEEKSTQPLSIHRDAFNASREFTLDFAMLKFNLDGINFFFLKGFINLKTITFESIANIHLADWNYFPLLPLLDTLIIKNMKLDDWIKFPMLDKGLKNIKLKENLICHGAMDLILQWLVDSKTVDTLESLEIFSSNLMEIPKKLFSFKNLFHFKMDHNPIKTLRSGSKIKSVYVSLISCQIDTIEPDSFQGYFVLNLFY